MRQHEAAATIQECLDLRLMTRVRPTLRILIEHDDIRRGELLLRGPFQGAQGFDMR